MMPYTTDAFSYAGSKMGGHNYALVGSSGVYADNVSGTAPSAARATPVAFP
jgi:hypothetical protein